MGLLVLVLTLALGPNGRACAAVTPKSEGHGLGCMMRHFTDAAALNATRFEAYASLTNGSSRIISSTLIASESVSFPLALWFESREAPLRALGVDILCQGLMPMSDAGPLVHLPVPVPGESFDGERARRGVAAFTEVLKAAEPNHDFDAMAQAAAALLGDLAVAPSHHCMVRHIAESIRRFAELAPSQISQADGYGLGWQTGELIRDLIFSHRLTLGLSEWLDGMAAPIQASGVPILCNDVPKIPPYSESESESESHSEARVGQPQ